MSQGRRLTREDYQNRISRHYSAPVSSPHRASYAPNSVHSDWASYRPQRPPSIREERTYSRSQTPYVLPEQIRGLWSELDLHKDGTSSSSDDEDVSSSSSVLPEQIRGLWSELDLHNGTSNFRRTPGAERNYRNTFRTSDAQHYDTAAFRRTPGAERARRTRLRNRLFESKNF